MRRALPAATIAITLACTQPAARPAASAQPPSAALAFARARFGGAPRAIVEGPAGDGGGTLTLFALDDHTPVAVLAAPGAPPRALALARTVPWADEAPGAARLADLDGDGLADVVLAVFAARASAGDPGPPHFVHAYLAPRDPAAAAMLDDDASAFALAGLADLDAAVRAARSVPRRGVDRDAACALVAEARTAEGFARASAPGARVLSFDEPALPTFRAAALPGAARVPTSYACGEFECAAGRPYCTARSAAEPGPASDAYWFAWDGPRLLLAGAATYGGS